MNKDKAIQRLLKEQFVSKNVIRLALGCSPNIAQEIFDAAKKIETTKCIVDPRPHRVQSRTVMKVTDTNWNYLFKQSEVPNA